MKKRKLAFFVLLFVVWGNVFSQNITVSGVVTEANDGSTLPGVNIIVKGATGGTITDIDGKYSLEVPKDATLVFSFIGFLKQEIAVNGNSTLNVALKIDATGLDEVIVVGYGVQKKSDITGAIASIKSDELSKTASLSVSSALQGRSSGVQVTANSGTPGGSVKIRIRGIGTIGDASPLYVIDGFPAGDMNSINPSDVESVEILKDASASAIYGARGANGVILVTTKTGKKGKAKVTYESYFGQQTLTNEPDITTGPEYYEILTQLYENGNKTLTLRPYADDPTHTTDWWNELIRVAPMQNHNISISGATDKTNYLLSGSLFRQDGTVVGSSYARETFRLNTNSNVKSWLKVGNTFSLSHNARTSVSEGSMYYGTVLNAMRTDPLTIIKDEEQDMFVLPAYQDIENPVAAREYDNNESDYYRMIGNIYVEATIFKDFKVRSSFGLDLDNTNSYNYIPEQYYLGSEKNDRPYNTVSRGYTKYQTWLNENTITYTKSVDKHSITAMAGFTAQESVTEWFSADKDTIPQDIPELRYLSAAIGEARVSGGQSENAMLSYLGRANYNYADKYLVTASMRVDGSSRFGKENRYGYFPSFALGWNIIHETFMQSVPAISNLKIRAGWGQIGNDRIGNYTYTATVDYDLSNTYILGGPNSAQHQVYGAAPDNFGNPFVRWETVESTNIGVDFGLFASRLTGTIDYYIKNTKDMLVTEPVPDYVGFLSNPVTNVGEMQNKGLELSLIYRKATGDFTYDVGLNFSTFTNELVSLGKGQPISAGSMQAGYIARNDVGQPIGSFYGFVTDGLFQTQEEIDAYIFIEEDGGETKIQEKAIPGDIRFKDIGSFDADGELVAIPDGKIDEADKTYIGNALPDFTYGINISCAYKGFDLSLFFQGVSGNDVFNATNWYLWHTSEHYNRSTELLNSWDGEGSTNVYPILNTKDRNGNNVISDRYVEDGSYIRLKNIQLGYTIPNELTSKIGISELRFYISGQNMLTFTKYSGLDPEIGNLYSDLSAGIDLGTYPQARITMFGVKFSF